jgi:hypothetical protein
VKTPRNDSRLNPSNGSEMAASATVHRFQEITEIPSATTNQTAPNTRDVTQSQLTVGESLVIEQPQGLETITNTDRMAASMATTAKAMAMEPVARSLAFRETAMAQV